MNAPRLDPDAVHRLRDALAAAEYSVDRVRDTLGELGSAALDRNETTPGRLATSGGSALETLTRLWPLQLPVPATAVREILPLDDLLGGGIISAHGETVRAAVDVRPYADDVGDWWVVSDLTPGLDGRADLVPDDHVLGVNAASSTLAQLTIREQVGRALDLGTGCGVQALHLSRHSDAVVATDVSERALAMAALTMALNELDVDLRAGNLYEPVADESFDLITTNPPFVVSPGGTRVYRDSGLSGDEMSRRVVIDGAARLADGGNLQALANWAHVDGTDWRERVGEWVARTGCDAWVIQREVQDPAAYVELWLRDSGEVSRPDYTRRYQEWLAWMDEQQITGVGFGWIMLRADGANDPGIRIEEWPHAVEQPLGPAVTAHFDAARQLRALASDGDLLVANLARADGVSQEQVGTPGEVDPDDIVMRQRHGLRRATRVTTAEAGLIGACDGTLPVGVLIAALAQVLEVEGSALRDELVPRVRELIADGYLVVQ